MARHRESVAEFKQRIARIMRERETGKRYSVVGAARPDRSVVRGPKDRGFYPAHLTVCSSCGSVNEIVNQCGCDPNNLPTTIK
jgi:hypothetical protein